MSDTEDYEALRQKNIAERNAFLKQFLTEIQEDTEEINNLEASRLKITQKENKPPRRSPRSPKRKRKRRNSSRDRSPAYTGSVRLDFKKKYNTRSRRKSNNKSNDSGNDEEEEHDLFDDRDILVPKKSSSLKVMFSWSRPMQRDIDLMNYDFAEEDDNKSGSEGQEDEDEEEIYAPKRRRVQRMSRSAYDPSSVPSPEEISQEMLDEVAVKASGKTYDAKNGSSCHQCRQKTMDTKTVCRSGECVGVRGQFCGPCLRGRYGESALEALKDPHWACPPCRGLCNCSICRTRNGQRPTGILAPFAKEEGYKSVKDYLQANDEDED